MSDKVTVTENISYGSRLKSALLGLIIWPILIIGSCILLWSNEYNSASTISNVNEWRKNINEASSNSINKELDWKFIHTSWQVIGEEISDSNFWITVSWAILDRKVEMYQWKEKSSTQTQENMWWSQTNTTTYTYIKEWSDEKIDSSWFNQVNWHENIKNWQYENTKIKSKVIKLWEYILSDSMSNLLQTNSKVIITNWNINNSTWITSNSDFIYIWKDPLNPNIWDMKISFSYLPNNTVISVLWEQNTNWIIWDYKWNLSRIEIWQKTSNEMFDNILIENKFLTWIIRLIGLFAMYFWFTLLFKILPTLWAFIPFIWNIIWFWTWIIAFLLTLVLGWLTIAIAWFSSRPMVSIVIIFILWIISFYIYKAKKKNNKDN